MKDKRVKFITIITKKKIKAFIIYLLALYLLGDLLS